MLDQFGRREKSIPVIASEAKQSRMFAKTKRPGSPRRFAPRDDGIFQCVFLRARVPGRMAWAFLLLAVLATFPAHAQTSF
ncbi:MAG TPA: hypothetical protein VJ325_05950, partial [Thiobacillus sp.]|nr:hypothetical protein [Thiobacillus sp.]